MFQKFFRKIEDFIIIAGLFFTITGFFNPLAELISFVISWALVADFLLTRVPSFLDRKFHTKAFRKDLSLKLALLLFPTLMLTMLLISEIGVLMLPKLLENFAVLNINIALCLIVLLIFVSIFYFSWRSWRYDERLAKTLWRSTVKTKEEFEWDYKYSKGKGVIPTINKYSSPGVAPTAICALLLVAWIIILTFDVFLVLFLLLLLVTPQNIKEHKTRTKIKDRLKSTYKVWKLFEETIWKGIFGVPLKGQVHIIAESIMIAGCFILLVLPCILNWLAILFLLGLNAGWYILIVLTQLIRRTRYRAKKYALPDHQKMPRLTLPKFSTITIPSCLAMLIVSSAFIHFRLYQAAFMNVAFLASSLALNTVCIASIIMWLKEKERRIPDTKKDRYWLYTIFFVVGLPWALAAPEIKGLIFWLAFSGAFILLTFSETIFNLAERKPPKIYATIPTIFYAIICYTILSAALYYFPELSTLLIYMYILFAALLSIMWIQLYKQKRDTLRK